MSALDDARSALLNGARYPEPAQIAMAQAYATLAVAEELARLNGALTSFVGEDKGAGSLRDQMGWLVDGVQRSVADAMHEIAASAMRNR